MCFIYFLFIIYLVFYEANNTNIKTKMILKNIHDHKLFNFF